MIDGIRDINNLDHNYYMGIAINEAIQAGERGDKAIGAVLVHKGEVIDRASNKWKTRNSKVHHAENCLVMDNAQFLRKYGKECIIYTTAEPCLMCLGTIVMADIRNIVIGTRDPFMHTQEFIESHEWLKERIFNYVLGVKEDECRQLIYDYCDESTIQRLLGDK